MCVPNSHGTERTQQVDSPDAAPIRHQIADELHQREAQMGGIFSDLVASAPVVEQICTALVRTLSSRGKVLVAGNGGSAAEAQHFTAELIGRFKRDRQPYPALSLTSDTSVLTALGNDYGFDQVFARQLQGLANPGDAFVAFSTSGRSQNLVNAATAGRALDVCTIAVTGSLESPLGAASAITFKAPATDTAVIQEIHLLFTHVVCAVLEARLSNSA